VPERNQLEDKLVEWIATTVGPEHLLLDVYECSLYAQDIFTKGLSALAVVRPGNTDELCTVVKSITEAGHAVIPRGGGMSYTSGYVPVCAGSVIVDLGRMNKIININEEDMYVTVESGCTWKTLHEALENTGLRTPFWGTLSGIKATVGGGLSQNSVFWGSGQFGSAVDSVISLDVVLADGSLIKTGSGAQINGSPFFRHFGPDLTGLFTCDTGALGFKARVTLKLIPQLPAKQYVAFDFKTAANTISAMSDIARLGLAMECFGFDPFLQKQRMKRESLIKDVKALVGVMKVSGSVLGALKDGAKVAIAGRGYMDDVDYSVQVIIEDRNQAAADARAEDVRAIGKEHNGIEIKNSIPKIARANPFGPLNSMLGPEGERWAPVHGLFPHSKIQLAYEAVEALFEKHREIMVEHKIEAGYLFALVSTNCFVLEPVFYWPDEMFEIHRRSVDAAHLASLKGFPANPEARAAVDLIRDEMVDLFTALGAVHLQIGKAYNYKEGIQANSLKLVQSIKNAVDPKGKMNPQSLGLE
jgi:FAD/FMN-containing dehydrogenase